MKRNAVLAIFAVGLLVGCGSSPLGNSSSGTLSGNWRLVDQVGANPAANSFIVITENSNGQLSGYDEICTGTPPSPQQVNVITGTHSDTSVNFSFPQDNQSYVGTLYSDGNTVSGTGSGSGFEGGHSSFQLYRLSTSASPCS